MKKHIFILLIISFIGAALRIAAAQNELWLDEIWSLLLTPLIKSPLGVFTIPTDNNHYLNTIWLYFTAASNHWWLHRFMSIICGIATPVLLYEAAGQGRRGVIAAAIGATSYLLVLYGSEARGYGPSCAFALASYITIGRWLKTGQWRWVILANLTLTIGFLWHLTNTVMIVAIAAWIIHQYLHDGIKAVIRHLLIALVAPLTSLAVLYIVHIRHMDIGGGQSHTSLQATIELLMFALGQRPEGLAPIALLIGWLAAIVTGLRVLHKEDKPRLTFFVTLLAVNFIVLPFFGTFVYPRYLITALPFLYMLLATAMTISSKVLQKSTVAIGCLLVVITLQIPAFVTLYTCGRGQYQQAMKDMAAATSPKIAHVSAESDFGAGLIINFNLERQFHGMPIVFVSKDQLRGHPTEWFIINLEWRDAPQPEIFLDSGVHYQLYKIYPSTEESGLTWAVYRLAPSS